MMMCVFCLVYLGDFFGFFLEMRGSSNNTNRDVI